MRGESGKGDVDGHRFGVDRHRTFCVTIYWGCCAGCTLYIGRATHSKISFCSYFESRTRLTEVEMKLQHCMYIPYCYSNRTYCGGIS